MDEYMKFVYIRMLNYDAYDPMSISLSTLFRAKSFIDHWKIK